jgi:alpha-amylase
MSLALLLPLALALSLLPWASAASKDQWKDKVLYQLLTDRFDQTTSTLRACSDLTDYCGGTFKGIEKRLDYIAGLGVDAIWISPVIENTDKGYHGYWAKNLYNINSHFGTKDELHSLIKAAHDRNLLVMVDVVANHMGEGMKDVPILYPFNDTKYYHDCGCVDGDCCPSSCWIEDYNNRKQMLHCQLFGLPDLRHESVEVSDIFVKWIKSLISEYQFDGIRLDTVPYVNSKFWQDFTAASGVFSIGEVSTEDVNWCAQYIREKSMDATLQYPLYHKMMNVFAYKNSFQQISQVLVQSNKAFGAEALPYLGVFVENHDNPRFLSQRYDIQAFRNAILFSLTTQGIPTIYYGQEQGYHGGGAFEANREPLWTSGFKTDSAYEGLYHFIQTIIRYRKSAKLSQLVPTEIWADDTFYAFSRGEALIALTNVGQGGGQISRRLSGYGVPYKKGTVVCNLFYATDCLTIQEDYQIDIVLMNGESKLFHPVQRQ